jgi:hypothetical protein
VSPAASVNELIPTPAHCDDQVPSKRGRRRELAGLIEAVTFSARALSFELA